MELQERIGITVEGQVTWADPSKGMKCASCMHLKAHPSPREHKPHQCQLVKVHTKKIGKPFDGKRAVACSMFSL